VIPPKQDARFVAAMELILDTYTAPPDPRVPLICFDEAGKELQAELREPQPLTAQHPRREDPEYRRQGSANLFLAVAPHLGWRRVIVREQRTQVEFAHAMRALVDEDFPDAERLIVVLDNLNTHHRSALYQTFPPSEAQRIAQKLEFRQTPVHGSWLNLAELELSALSRQCLHRRIPDPATLTHEVEAWVTERNAAGVRLNWHFTCAHARTRLAHLYPLPEPDTSPVTDYSE
jgi:hypothetical protein